VEGNRGVALILALLVLSFLTILGSALLTTSNIDIWISDNYRNANQSLYLAEAGIEDGRELLRSSGRSITELFSIAAGDDRLLLSGDDLPFIPSRRITGDSKERGSYEVWLQNDHADGLVSFVDSNDIVTLLSHGNSGTARRTLEVTLRKGGFPESDDDSRLTKVSFLEGLVRSIKANATDVYAAAALTDVGAPSDYRVVFVDGDVELGPGRGYGLLLVRGSLNVTGEVTWNGLILVIGQGVLYWAPGISGVINGGLFVARTRAADGSLAGETTTVTFDVTDPFQIQAANQTFPYVPIAIRER
jgi:hypothetical protein